MSIKDGKYYLPDAYVKTGYSGFDPNIPVSTLWLFISAYMNTNILYRDVAAVAVVAAAAALALLLLRRLKLKPVCL